MINRCPLEWPTGWPKARHRRDAPFKVEPSKARKELIDELHRLGATHIVVTSNMPLNRDGSISMARMTLMEPGVSVYFRRKGRETVLACDQYYAVHDNMRAIGKTIEAMRIAIEWKAEGDQVILYMGEIIAGRVMATGGRGNKPRWLFAFKPYSSWATERSVDLAKAAVERSLEEWLRKAGIR